jgi:diguanylate cyclase (GGDEF)-like protein/PAS domain S-box-containing protein
MIEARSKRPTPIEQSYRSLVENIKDYAIFMLDKKGKVASWDQGGVKLFGYTRKEIIGKKFSILFMKEDLDKGVPDTDMAVAIAEGRHLDERYYKRKDGTTFCGSGVLTSTRDKNGTHQGFSQIMRDVTEQTDLHNTAVHNSTHDFLTGLPSRNFFEENLMESIPKTKKGNILAVIYMDFDNFKKTNDEEGHRIGDLVLIEIAHRLTQSMRISDMVARFGGDEFVVLAKQLRSKPDAIRVAQKIVEAFDEPIRIQKKIIKTSVSVGVALYPWDAKKPGELLRFSDMALYEAKKLGGNQFQFFTQSPADKVLKKK